jgi:nucleoside-diphosphate-sugar epimerase
MTKILVTGAGGFIGGHLVSSLLAQGFDVRAVDIKPLNKWYQKHPQAENESRDLSKLDQCIASVGGVKRIYNLAADMGGMGFIESHKADCMLTVLINTHMLMAAKEAGVSRFFFSSSACVYSAMKQEVTNLQPLRESDAYPAMPEDGYGWEKLFSERMCRHFSEDFGIETKVARYHNVYGPFGTYDGGREKAPAAICRKIAQAKISGSNEIEIWGDGNQTRSFMYIDDCVKGTEMIMNDKSSEPVNLGSEEMVSINQLVSITEEIAGTKVERRYNLNAPQGVRGRTSDNTMMREIYNWEPTTSLLSGITKTYEWIYDEMVSGRPAI